MREFNPLDVSIDNERSVVDLSWGDGHKSSIPVRRLRGYCPCAECQGHGGEIRWIENQVTGIFAAEPVGRYAILFSFSDGHATGIYRWETLRKLDPAEAQRWGNPEEFLRQG
jgi:DUF971 family protein